jgi:transposase
MKSRAYRSVSVNDVKLEQLLVSHQGREVVVGLDIGKKWILVVLRIGNNEYSRPWRVSNPHELPVLVGLLTALSARRSIKIAMEPTGSYGEALRQALAEAKLPVYRVSPKASHDHAETFDGVPSQHDGKDAAIVAELAAFGKCSPWNLEPESEADQELSYQVDSYERHKRQSQEWYGQLEALLTRHWPEATEVLKLTSAALQRVLEEYGDPAKWAADPKAVEKLQRWGRHYLKAETAEALRASALKTRGLQPTTWDVRRLQDAARALREHRRESAKIKRRLEELCNASPVRKSMSTVAGKTTACIVYDAVGDPKDYHCAAAYRKAMGLNLKERSSGKHQGKLMLTKRGPSLARKYLYLAAVRLVKTSRAVRAWYQRHVERRQGKSKPVFVALMRKLAMALWQVGANGEKYDAERVVMPRRREARTPTAARTLVST